MRIMHEFRSELALVHQKVVSVDPRCHWECGLQRWSGTIFATVNSWYLASLGPWSQLVDFASSLGNFEIASLVAASTDPTPWLS